jgi:hypothetical protein
MVADNNTPEDSHEASEGVRQWFFSPDANSFFTTNSKGDWVALNEATARKMLILEGKSASLTKEELAAGVRLTEVDLEIIDIKMERLVDYAGVVAGWKRGVHTINGSRVLVTSEMSLVAPRRAAEDAPARADGSCRGWPTLGGQFARWLSSEGWGQTRDGAWAHVPAGEKAPAGWRAEDEGCDQRPYLWAWLARWYGAALAGRVVLGHAVVFAGNTGCGKTFFVQMLEQIFGGRSAQPYKFLVGGQFNADLIGASVLTIDDEASKTDMKSRKDIGAHVKQFVAVPKLRMEGKGDNAVILSLLNRLIFCVNLTPDNLSVLPPPSEDLVDADGKSGKIMLFKFYAHGWEGAFGSVAEQSAFWRTIMAELPHFLWWLLNEFVLPAELYDDRFGVRPWMHPEILESLEELSPWQRILGLIDRELFKAGGRDRWVVSSESLHTLLTNEDSGLPGADKASLKSSYMHLGEIAAKRPLRCQDLRGMARGKVRAFALFREGYDFRTAECRDWVKREVAGLVAAKGGAAAMEPLETEV